MTLQGDGGNEIVGNINSMFIHIFPTCLWTKISFLVCSKEPSAETLTFPGT